MPTILVTGATGKQGGATIKALLASNRTDIKILALTRNPSSSSATALSNLGVTTIKGDLSDRDTVLHALKGVDVAHLVTDFTGPKGAEGEIEQGVLFVDCAKETGIKHIVFSSAAGAAEAVKIPHFHSKHVIETHLISSEIPYTILYPTTFMENTPAPGSIGRFFLLGVMKAIFGDDKIYHIACEDIGKVAAKALLDEGMRGKSMALVGQIASADEMKAALDRAEGYESRRFWVPRWVVMRILPSEFYEMFSWLSKTYANNEMPGSVEELRDLVGNVVDIETWARNQKATRDADAVKKEL